MPKKHRVLTEAEERLSYFIRSSITVRRNLSAIGGSVHSLLMKVFFIKKTTPIADFPQNDEQFSNKLWNSHIALTFLIAFFVVSDRIRIRQSISRYGRSDKARWTWNSAHESPNKVLLYSEFCFTVAKQINTFPEKSCSYNFAEKNSDHCPKFSQKLKKKFNVSDWTGVFCGAPFIRWIPGFWQHSRFLWRALWRRFLERAGRCSAAVSCSSTGNSNLTRTGFASSSNITVRQGPVIR